MIQKVVVSCLLCTGALAVAAAPADDPPRAPITDEINRGVPSWLKFSGEERIRYENLDNVGFAAVNDGYLLNRFRLGLEIKPTSWLKFNFQAQDSRVYGQNTLPAPATQK